MTKEELKQKKELIELKYKREKEITEMKFQMYKYQRESSDKRHEQELVRIRIKTAEIKRTQDRRANRDFANSYMKGGK